MDNNNLDKANTPEMNEQDFQKLSVQPIESNTNNKKIVWIVLGAIIAIGLLYFIFK